MKRIIHGLMYDTDNADEIAGNGLETLYVTNNGRWFVCRPMTLSWEHQLEALGGMTKEVWTYPDQNNASHPETKPNHRLVEWFSDNARADLLKKYFDIEVQDA